MLKSIRIRLFLIFCLILIGSFVLIGYQEMRTATRIIQEDALHKAQTDLSLGLAIIDLKYPGPWRAEGGLLYKGETLMNDNDEIVDLIGELAGGDTATLFLGDTRIATNVMIDGKRAVGTRVSDAVKERVLERGEMYLGQADVLDHTYQTAYVPIRDGEGAIIGMFYVGAPDSSERIEDLRKDVLLEISLQVALVLVLAMLLLFAFTRPMLNRIGKAASALRQIAAGDLSRPPLHVKSGDETGQLMGSVNELQQDLRRIIADIQSSSEQLAASSELMIANVKRTSDMGERIASSIQEVASGSERQLEEFGRADQAVTNISAGMDRAAQFIRQISDFSQEASARAQAGADKVERTVRQMAEVQQTVGETAEVIRHLDEESRKIGEIVLIMKEIADQTHLLSLNAEIEAARAGEAGRGFAVVADEVRKLAERSAASARDVEGLITLVQAEAQKAVQSVNNGVEAVGGGMRRVEETGQVFREIAGTIHEMVSQYGEVTDVVERVHRDVGHIVRLMEQVSAISQRTSANAQDVAEAAEGQADSWREMAASAETLGKLAEQLRQMIRKFKV